MIKELLNSNSKIKKNVSKIQGMRKLIIRFYDMFLRSVRLVALDSSYCADRNSISSHI